MAGGQTQTCGGDSHSIDGTFGGFLLSCDGGGVGSGVGVRCSSQRTRVMGSAGFVRLVAVMASQRGWLDPVVGPEYPRVDRMV